MAEEIHPRLEKFGPENLSDAQLALYEQFTGGQRQQESSYFPVVDEDGVLSGPYRAMLLNPSVGVPLEKLGVAVRFGTELIGRHKELAILAVAHLMSSELEWKAHQGLAEAAGVPARTIESLRNAPWFECDMDEMVYRFVVSMIGGRVVPDTVYESIYDYYGNQGLFSLVAVVGYYQLIAHINNVFDLKLNG